MELASPLLRCVLGQLFVGHGTQKLFGWFGGHGLDGSGQYFESLGLRPGRRQALAAGTAEAVSGALLTAGALRRSPGRDVGHDGHCHPPRAAEHRPWITEGGYEYALTIIAATAAITERGPGRLSVDAALLPRIKGPRLAAAQIGAAVVASYLLDRLSREAPGAAAEGQTVRTVNASATGPTRNP